MKQYSDIKDFTYRCETHPDHQSGVIAEWQLRDRLHEEIFELREYLEDKEMENDRLHEKIFELNKTELDKAIVYKTEKRAKLVKAVEDARAAYSAAYAAYATNTALIVANTALVASLDAANTALVASLAAKAALEDYEENA